MTALSEPSPPADPLDRAAARGSSRPTEPWPFIAREFERRYLDDWLAAGPAGGVVLYGGVGVGRSTLARRWIATSLTGERQRIVRCTRASSLLPLGSLRLLIGDTRVEADHTRLPAIEQALRELGQRNGVLLVEDAQWIDPASGHLLRRILLEEATGVLLTVSTTAPTSPALTDLVKEHAVQSLQLGPLAVDEVAHLLEIALAGPVDAEMVGLVFEVSEGNPLFVRELVTASLATGAIRLDEVWTLARPLELSTRLTDLIFERIDALSPAAQQTLRIVAEAGSLELDLLLALAAPESIAELELAGLVDADEASAGQHRSAHTLYEEVVLAHTPSVERRATCGRLADALERLDRPGDGPFLEVIRWRLGSLDAPAAPDLERAQALAMAVHDFDLAAECGRLLWQRFGTPEEALALGDALFAMHSRDSLVELEEVLARCQATMAPTDARLSELIGLRALNLGVGIGRIDDARDLIEQLIAGVSEPAEADRLAMALGATFLYSGYPDRALEVFAKIDLEQQVLGELHWCNALWMAGRIAELQARLASTQPRGRQPWTRSAEAACLLYLGELDAAEVQGNASLAHVAVTSTRTRFAYLEAQLVVGWLSMMRGQSQSALPHFATAADALDGMALAVVPLSHLAVAAAHAGDLRLAHRSLLNVEVLKSSLHEGGGGERGLDAITLHAVALARAWVAVAEGRSNAEAAGILQTAAAQLGRRGERLNEAWLLHEAVCLGSVRAGDVVRLGELEGEIGGRLAPLWSAHAAALLDQDVSALSLVSDQLLELGAVRDAVRSAWSAWSLGMEGGRSRASIASLAQLQALLARTDWQPSLRPPTVAAGSLTAREREVAHLAALGLASKEIAETLSLSTRTVDNNLQRVYVKLGVSGRRALRGLRTLFEPDPA
ncbi:MAG: transcriptional regulator, LuxR family [Acidimicrobiales bacterium]|nr:transcriptional regulator, LuxR family [Acidimicrobiales bacterium]